MPPLTARLIRIALVYFMLGASLGTILLWEKATPGTWPWIWSLRAAHVEFLIFGFVIQLAFGVANWIFPSAPTEDGEPKKQGRRSKRGASPVLPAALLNVGVWVVAMGYALAPGWVLVGRLAELAGMALFAAGMVPRIRARVPVGH